MSSEPLVGNKVLVVDDDAQYLKLAARLLRTAGYDVVTRSDATGTSSVVASERPDLVLFDLNPPPTGADGRVPLIDRARLESPDSVPYVVLHSGVLHSGVDETSLDRRAWACGADASIPKGIAPDEFLSRVANCFARAAAARELRAGLEG